MGRRGGLQQESLLNQSILFLPSQSASCVSCPSCPGARPQSSVPRSPSAQQAASRQDPPREDREGRGGWGRTEAELEAEVVDV